jgi:WD40 repeat protein
LYLKAQNKIETQSQEAENEAFAKAVKLYNETFHNHEKVFTGKYHSEVYKGIKGHPYYNELIWKTGSVVYKNQRYDGIEIKYDIYKDILLIKYIDLEGYIRSIQLYSAKIDAFHIYDHQFINLKGDSLSHFISGFYDLLFKGDNISVLAKRRKEVNQSTTLTSLEERFITNDLLYIDLDRKIYDVKNRKSILEIFSDKKNELKSFLKLNKRRFRNDPEEELVAAVRYYVSIVNDNGS